MSLFGRMRKFFGGHSSRPVDVGSGGRPIRARYDAAQTTDDNAVHWAMVDSCDADSANSLAVRSVLRRRGRYEIENNGHGKGIEQTQANYVVGRGPKLRLSTKNKPFNAMVEAAWTRWWKRVKGSRKLRTAVKAKVKTGEGFLVAKANPALRDPVKLDLVGIEADQFTTPMLPFNAPNRIDGIKFDDYGNPESYDLLRYHPGSPWSAVISKPDSIDARFVFHLFREDRPNQHRGIPEVTSTLGLFAAGRRFREATIAAAETAADHAAVLKVDGPANDEPDELRPFSTIPLEKRTMTMLPYKWELQQLKAEHPATTYVDFNRINNGEEARPLSMSYSIASCDSSGNSFSGTQNDHLIYFTSVDVEQQDAEDLVLDPLFELWFSEAVLRYGWNVTADPAPPHAWGWPARPKIDEEKTARARQTNLATMVAAPSDVAAEDGIDDDDHVQQLADDYGVTPEEIRQRRFEVNVLSKGGQFAPVPAADQNDNPPPKPAGKLPAAKAGGFVNRLVSANGNGRHD